LFVLANLRQTGVEDLQKALKDRDSPIRELALRLLAGDVRRIAVVEPESARTIAPRAMAALPDVVPLAGDPDAGVRRELLLALRDVPTSQAGSALRTLVNGWDGRDRYYLEALHLALRDRDGAFLANLFAELARSALADGWNDEPVALPPYFPVTTNDAYLHIGDELPPANAASKAIGLAWVLRRPEALPALRALLERNQSAHVAQAAELAIVQLDDPRAAELLLERFLAHDADPDRQRQILRRLGMKLGGGWKRARDTALADKVFLRALGSVELRVEAIQAIARCGAGRYAERLMELVHAEREEPATRSAALEALGELRYEPARRLAAQLVEEGKSKAQGGPLPMAAVAALARFRGAEAHGVLENMARDQQYPLDLRRRATQVLAATTTGARRLLSLREQSQFPEDLVTELTFLLHHHPDPNVRRVARATIELPKTASGTRIEDLDKVLSLRGDAARGRAVFFRDQSACARCHRVCGVGESGGPDLSSIGTKYAKSELLYHLLNPSGAINYNYVTYAFSMTDGRLLNGLITDESADVIELKTPQGERVSLPKSEIEAKRPQNTSLMPDGLVETMTEQDVADLIDYLASLRQSTSPVGEYYLLGPVPARTFPEAVAIDVHTAWVAPSGRRYAWRRVATNRDQTLDLSALLGNDEGLEVLSLVPVVSDRPQTARVVLNTSIPVSLTHNGRAIPLDRPRDSQSSFCEVPLSLQAGVNDLVIRAAAGTGRAALRTTIVSDHAVRFAFDRAR
jgi:putative heme-binding domain-containing protein